MDTQKLILVLIMFSLTLPGLSAQQFDGVLHWARRVELGMPVSGVIAKVSVKVGDEVDKAQILLQLDRRQFRAKVQQAKAAQLGSEQILLETKREFDRASVLYQLTVLSSTELEKAESAFKTAQANLSAAQAHLAQVRVDLGYAVMRAPFAGMIAQRNVEMGQTIVSRLQADPLLVLVEKSRMIARIQVSAATLKRFSVGLKVKVTVASQTYTGQVLSVGIEPEPSLNPAVYAVAIEFNSPGQLLRAGQSVSILLPK